MMRLIMYQWRYKMKSHFFSGMFSKGEHPTSGSVHDSIHVFTEGKFVKKNIFVFLAACLIAAMPLVSCQQDVIGADQGTALELSASGVQRSVTAVNAIAIHDQTEWEAIDDDLGEDYVLANDLVLSNYAPIGDPNFRGPFAGTLDGAGHTITISSFSGISAHLGLIAETEPGVNITNLTVNYATGTVTTTAQYVGGVVAQATGTVFDNVNVGGELRATLNN
jgi:hypothetical protein